MNNFVNDEKVLQIVTDSDKYISSVDEHILLLKNAADVIKELCLKAQTFLPLSNSDVSLNFSSIWNVERNAQILQNVDLLDSEIDELRDKLLEFINLNSNVEDLFEQIQQYRSDIEDVFASDSVSNVTSDNVEVAPVIDKEEVLGAIGNILANKDLNNKVNSDVYHKIYDDVVNVSSNR